MRSAKAAPPSALGWLLRFALAFGLLNTLLTFENRWPGFGVAYMPRLSFELCLAVGALMGWVTWRGSLSPRAATAGAVGFMALVLVRYASVTAPAVMGRPVNVYWDGRHASELLRVAAQSWPVWQGVVVLLALLIGTLLLTAVARGAIAELARCLAWERPRPWLLAGVGACTLSFAAYVPEQRDTRWFFSLPLTPTLVHQGQLLAGVWLPGQATQVLGPSPAFDGDLSGLVSDPGAADVLLVFAESYGAITFDDTAQAAALAAPRSELAEAIRASGRFVVSSRVKAPTFGGASWLSHAALLAGVDTSDPADHDLLLTSQRPTLVSHFARHGYRTVGWMPGLKRPWPEGVFYGFDRLADDAGIGYRGPDFGYWRIPDQAAMALLQAQELDRAADRSPRFAVFATTSTHAPFHPVAPFVQNWRRLTQPDAYMPAEMAAALAAPLSVTQPLPQYLESLRYQFAWLADYLRRVAPRPLVMVIVGDHQPPALVNGPGASWDVPVHVVSDDPALLQRLLGSGFVPGLTPPAQALGPLHQLTTVLLKAFDAPGAGETLGIEHVAVPDAPRSAPGS
ncbi:sulfatase-like hydrolase/transferase [Hydrogenophaga sp.]|uniref:sulfatase-like hydrolase/transferase n=1 Tax=Hydrogenophaga sp. TaxID=1904254 RepID=UPI002FC5FBD4